MTLRRKLFAVFAATTGMLVGALSADAADNSPGIMRTSASHLVTIKVLPYVEVRLDKEQLTVPLPAQGGSSGAIFVGGMVRTNFPVVLSVSITPPPNAPTITEWEVETLVNQVTVPGEHRFDKLLRIEAFKISSSYQTADHYLLNLAAGVSPTPGPVVTVARATGSATAVPSAGGGSAYAYGGSSATGGGSSSSGFSFAFPGHTPDSYYQSQGGNTVYGWSSVWGTAPAPAPQPGPPGTVTLLVMPRP